MCIMKVMAVNISGDNSIRQQYHSKQKSISHLKNGLSSYQVPGHKSILISTHMLRLSDHGQPKSCKVISDIDDLPGGKDQLVKQHPPLPPVVK